MTPAELRAARERLGLTQTQLAEALGMAARHEHVQRMESGAKPIHPRTVLQVRSLLERVLEESQ
jgi:transcriptional regulator with XRE-family HTH domain